MIIEAQPYYKKWCDKQSPDKEFQWGELQQVMGAEASLVSKRWNEMTDSQRELQFLMHVHRTLNKFL